MFNLSTEQVGTGQGGSRGESQHVIMLMPSVATAFIHRLQLMHLRY